ncbi:NUDIX domain-containing protein [Dactylosporangium sp. NPDC049140]|uniref:NUDIX hydrolase n=1 Tax=Dactylosporangium sp. NPDC049140 TaxID=3155647 RepID=UPI0033CE0336
MIESVRPPTLFRLAVDLVIFTMRDERLQVLLVERGKEPFLGRAALPGGFVRLPEDLDATATRELEEETGLEGRDLHLEQLRCYAREGRDPRGAIASVAYLAIAPNLPTPVAGTDAARAMWVPVLGDKVDRSLAFDHAAILRDGLDRARAKLESMPIAASFCGAAFTISELRRVYEAVWGVRVDAPNFYRKVTKIEGFIEETGELQSLPAGRPAKLYRRGPATILQPPMLRPGRSSGT